mgnify:CR=1 FL=1
MISDIETISKDLNSLNNKTELEFIQEIIHLDTNDIINKLEEIWIDEDKDINKNISKVGLVSEKYQKLKDDFEYRNKIGILRRNEKRQTKKEQALFVLARILFHRHIIKQLLNFLRQYIRSLTKLPKKLTELDIKNEKDLKEIFKIVDIANKSHGLLREIEISMKDYILLYDALFMLFGNKAERYGKTFKSDIFSDEINAAILELSCSRTMSCVSAGLLIRPMMEIHIRMILFKFNPYDSIYYIPTKKLDVPGILSGFKNKKLKLTYSYDFLNAVWENLNLITHIGYWQSPGLLWYFYGIVKNISLIKDIPDYEISKEDFHKQSSLKVLEFLKRKGLVEIIDISKESKPPGLDIYWRI